MEKELNGLGKNLQEERDRMLELSSAAKGRKASDLKAATRLMERSLFHVQRALGEQENEDSVQAQEGEMLDIEIEEDLLDANRELARENRELLKKHGVQAVDVMGAIGSGKTSLIACLVGHLRNKSVGMLGGDTATSIDADRVRESGAMTVQINTGKECHLDANLVARALQKIDLNDLDLLFVENVGNLICPSEFDLGCDKRLVVISVTEGDSMVVKHPMMFADADVVAINKIDILDTFGSDPDKLEQDLKQLNPRAVPVRTSVRTGQGIEELIDNLDLD